MSSSPPSEAKSEAKSETHREPHRAFAVPPSDAPARSKLAVLTGLALVTSAVPIPLLPDRVIGRIRGAIAHDVLARAGLSMTSDARSALAAADASVRGRMLIRSAADLLTSTLLKRLGPVGILTTVARALEVYAFGHLLHRYATRVRAAGTVRLNEPEARALREAIDKAIVRAFSPALRPNEEKLGSGIEDLRDEFTRWVDTLLLTGASVPGYVERRLDAAFDEVVAQSPGLGRG